MIVDHLMRWIAEARKEEVAAEKAAEGVEEVIGGPEG